VSNVPRLSPTLASSLSSVDPRAFSPRGVVFDLFHTLVDPEDFRPAGFLRAAAVASTLRVAEDRFTSFWSDTAQHRLLGHVSPRESMMEFLAKEGLAREKEFLRLVDEADHLLGRDQEAALLKPRPEVLEALALLRERGLRLGLLSNADKREIRRWRESPLAEHFAAPAFSCLCGYAKPDIRAYQAAIAPLGVAAQECAFVGNGGAGELQGAKEAGFALVVFMRWFVDQNEVYSPEQLDTFERQADVSVATFQELTDLLT